MIMQTGTLMSDFLQLLISSIPESEFEARLKECGIEDRNIIKLKEMAGYDTAKKEE